MAHWVFEAALERLARVMEQGVVEPPTPLQADTWITRSVLQKAIRRGDGPLALRAAATLLQVDRRTLWRRLVVTALEDLGPPNMHIIDQVVAAYADRARRSSLGEWSVVAALITQMADAPKSQAANDLYNIAKNDLDLDPFRLSLVDADSRNLLDRIGDPRTNHGELAVAILLGLGEPAGDRAPSHFIRDVGAVFEVLGPRVGSVGVTVLHEACRQAGLALAPLNLALLPNVTLDGVEACEVPKTDLIGEVPAYALDQYTRTGKAALRHYVARNEGWAAFARKWGLPSAIHAAAAGELLFRYEGAAIDTRPSWSLGIALHQRSLRLGCFMPPEAVAEGLLTIAKGLPAINELRRRHLPIIQ